MNFAAGAFTNPIIRIIAIVTCKDNGNHDCFSCDRIAAPCSYCSLATEPPHRM